LSEGTVRLAEEGYDKASSPRKMRRLRMTMTNRSRKDSGLKLSVFQGYSRPARE